MKPFDMILDKNHRYYTKFMHKHKFLTSTEDQNIICAIENIESAYEILNTLLLLKLESPINLPKIVKEHKRIMAYIKTEKCELKKHITHNFNINRYSGEISPKKPKS